MRVLTSLLAVTIAVAYVAVAEPADAVTPAREAPTKQASGETTDKTSTSKRVFGYAEQAILINPTPATISLLAAALSLPLGIINLRYHRVIDRRVGLTIAPAFSHFDAGATWTVVGVRAGPRFTWRGKGLRGWYMFPFGMVGWGWVTALGRDVTSAPMAGLGMECGYTFIWGPVAMELGTGLYASGFAFDGDVPPLFNPRPIFNASLGYNW